MSTTNLSKEEQTNNEMKKYFCIYDSGEIFSCCRYLIAIVKSLNEEDLVSYLLKKFPDTLRFCWTFFKSPTNKDDLIDFILSLE